MAWQPQGHYDSPYPDPTPSHASPSINGFKEHDLDDDPFAAKGGIVSAFDAFRKLVSHPVLRCCPIVTVTKANLVRLDRQLNPNPNM